MVRKLLYLNGLAALNVVLYHASGWGFTAMFWWSDRYRAVSVPNFDQFGSPFYFVLRLVEQWVIFSIPAFLFVSGFFLAFAAGRADTSLRWSVVLVRIRNLVIPFLIWSTIILALDVLTGRELSLGEFALLIISGRAADPFYFVIVLIELYLISPLVIRFARTNWKTLLLVAGLIQIFVVILRYPIALDLKIPALEPFYFLSENYWLPNFAFYFLLGMVFGFHNQAFKPWLFRMRWILMGATIVFFFLGIFEWEIILRQSGQDWIGPRETLVDQIFAGLFILTYFAFEKAQLPFSNAFSTLGTKSYGIYLVHTVGLVYTAKIIYNLLPRLLGFPLVFQILLIIGGLGFPLLLMEFVNRTPARRYYSILFG
jgi:peptidoglycan/LPS O-acetylase OafA/YrhL